MDIQVALLSICLCLWIRTNYKLTLLQCNATSFHWILKLCHFCHFQNEYHTYDTQPTYSLCNNRICVYIFFLFEYLKFNFFFRSYDVIFILQQIVRTQNWKQRQKKTIIDWEKFLFFFLASMKWSNSTWLPYFWEMNSFCLGVNIYIFFSNLYIHKIKLRLCNFLRFTSLYFYFTLDSGIVVLCCSFCIRFIVVTV